MSKKLYRSRKNRTIGGVAAGLADYFELDPTLIRIIFVVSLFLGGSGVIAYILLWIIVPEEPYPVFTAGSAETPSEEPSGQAADPELQYQEYFKLKEERKRKRLLFLGIGLILAGLFFLADNFIPHIHFTDFLSIVLIGIGIGLLLNSRKLNTN